MLAVVAELVLLVAQLVLAVAVQVAMPEMELTGLQTLAVAQVGSMQMVVQAM